jgi:hypothetical protein
MAKQFAALTVNVTLTKGTGPGTEFNPSLLRYSGIWGVANEVIN